VKDKIKSIKILLSNNKKVIENYFFMTVLQVLNALFYLLIYPFLIRTLGAESYGLYVFVTAIISYFVIFIGFGFDLPAVKSIAQNVDDLSCKAHTLSCIFTAKIYLEVLSLIVFTIIVFSIPAFRVNWFLFYICFFQTLTNILFPQWYFQGVQRMRIVTYIQLIFKIISLPLIFLTIHSPTDLWIFLVITSSVSVAGAATAAFIVHFKEGVQIRWMPYPEVRIWFKDAFPFFLSSSAGIIKEQSIAVIIGLFFGMRDVAIYDLANKIVMVPRTLLMSVNGALFPKIIANIQSRKVKMIINYEIILGLFVVSSIIFFGKWFVLIMGGSAMITSYPLAVVLSITVLSWLVVGSYINFVFIPHHKYYYITKNQFIAFLSFFFYCLVGLMLLRNIFVLAIAISLSGLTEIVYCKYIINKNNLL